MDSFNPKRNDFEPYGFSCVRWKASLMSKHDRHNEVELNLLKKGELTYLFGGHKIVVPSRQMVIFWAGIPHQVININGLNEYYVMTIPLSSFLNLRLPSFFIQKLLQGIFIADTQSSDCLSDEIRFESWLKDLEHDSKELKSICFLEIEARLRRFVFRLESTDYKSNLEPLTLGEGDLNNVEKMAVFIAQNFTESLTTDVIASSVDLHPNYAMRLFRKTFGKTMIDYITEIRLSHAQRLLITSNDLVIDISHNSGFGSLSRFNSAFKKAFNCTPSEYRKRNSLAV